MHGAGTTPLTSGRSPATISPRTCRFQLRASPVPSSPTYRTHSTSQGPNSAFDVRHSAFPMLHHGCNTCNHLPIRHLQHAPPTPWCNFRACTTRGAPSQPQPTSPQPRPATPHGASRPDGAWLHHGCNTCKHQPIRHLQSVISASWCNFRDCTTRATSSRPRPTLPPVRHSTFGILHSPSAGRLTL
jgi:hypothetical protein